jgi:hypothetical protein
VETAEASKTALDTAQTEAMALPDDADRASLITAIEDAMGEVDTQIEMAEAQRDDAGLKVSIAKIENPDTAEVNPKRDADWHGEQVAMDVADAIDPDSEFGEVAFSTATADASVVKMDDNRMGMTFEMIVGEENLKAMRIDRTDDDSTVDRGTVEVQAASFAGMKLSAIPSDASNPARPAAGSEAVDGDQWTGTYKGIAGTIFCAGDDCKVSEAEDLTNADTTAATSTLTGSWYFAPGDAKETYTKAATDTEYSQEMDFVEFGYWFETTNGNIDGNINVIAGIPTGRATASNPDVEQSADPDDPANTLEATATYTGLALGLSVYKPDEDNDGEHDSISSGAFTADVELTAQFGSTDRKISGTVTNFQGNATNSEWEATLDEVALTSGGDEVTGTTSIGVTPVANPGAWNATAAGPSGARPIGYFGTFSAHWVDGHAAAGYATCKGEDGC